MLLIETMSGQPMLLSILISLIVSIVIAVAGVIPSTFVTAANIAYFGFNGGLFVSIAGEALGAIISFFLYRKGTKKLEEKFLNERKIKWIQKLKNAGGKEAFFLVLLLRIFPFAPSGLVTLAASISKIGAVSFAVSSTIGKVPALLIEAYSIHMVFGWEREYQLGAAAFALAGIVWYDYWIRKKERKDSR